MPTQLSYYALQDYAYYDFRIAEKHEEIGIIQRFLFEFLAERNYLQGT
ncbi:MAG: hypothetical protein RLO17_08395 [Cyclobacteriaceae bacterium]